MSKELKPWALVTGAGGFIGDHLVSYLKSAVALGAAVGAANDVARGNRSHLPLDRRANGGHRRDRRGGIGSSDGKPCSPVIERLMAHVKR